MAARAIHCVRKMKRRRCSSSPLGSFTIHTDCARVRIARIGGGVRRVFVKGAWFLVASKSGLRHAAYADVARVGLPQALLYYRYGTLWTTFFQALGREVVVTRPTDRAIVERGDALSNDECCLASKIYMGHVEQLVGACDAVFVPSMANVGLYRTFCTKFQSLPDLVVNTFADRRLRVASCLVNEKQGFDMDESFRALAQDFGASKKEAKRAWKEAARAQERVEKEAAEAQARAVVVLDEARKDGGAAPMAILLAAHPYVAHDPYLGGSIVDMLRGMGAEVLFADEHDRRRGIKASEGFSETMPWVVNRELVGAIELLSAHVDGIVLVSAFPCGPDSMTDDAVVRCLRSTPILNLTIDAQSGTAGLETRIESFVDILSYQRKGGYVHVS